MSHTLFQTKFIKEPAVRLYRRREWWEKMTGEPVGRSGEKLAKMRERVKYAFFSRSKTWVFLLLLQLGDGKKE